MSAIFPTSTPWQTKHDFDVEGRTTIIGNVDGEIVDGTTHHSFDFVARTLDEDDDSQSRSIAVANAEFIVRACNSHQALVAALDAALDALALCSPSPAISSNYAKKQEATSKGRTALANARGAA